MGKRLYYYILNREIQEFLVKIKVLFRRSLNSVSPQCARGKSLLAWKPEVHPNFFNGEKLFPPDFTFYLDKLNLYGALLILCVFTALNNTKKGMKI